MSSTGIFPYQTLVGNQLHLAPIGQLELRPDGSIDAREITDQLALTLDCSLDLDAASDAISDDEPLDTTCAILILAKSVNSRRRECVLTLPPKNQQQATIALEKIRHRGVLELTAVLVRQTQNGRPDPHRSGAEGTRLGVSAPVRVHFDEPATAPGQSLDIEWIHFIKAGKPEGHIFAIEETATAPKIFLNLDIDRLFQVFHSTANSGRKAAAREAIYATVAHQVWTSLIASALVAAKDTKTGLSQDGEEPDAESVLANMADWQQRVLEHWAPLLVGETDPDLALKLLLDQLGDDMNRFLISQVTAAIQQAKFTGTPQKIEMMIRNIGIGS